MSPLLDFGGRIRHSIFEFLLRVAAVPVGPRSHAAMGAQEASAAIRGSLDLELMTSCVAPIVRSETVSSRTPRSIPLRVALEQFADVRPTIEGQRNSHVRLLLLQR